MNYGICNRLLGKHFLIWVNKLRRMVGAPAPSASREHVKLWHRMSVCWCRCDSSKTKLALRSGSLWWAGSYRLQTAQHGCVFWCPSTRKGNLRFPNDFPSSQSCYKIKYKSFLNVPSFPSFRKFSVNGKQSRIQRIKAIVILLLTASITWLSFHAQNFQFTNHLKNRKFGGNTCLW